MITLTPKEQPEVPIEIDTITPDSLAGKTIDEIKNIPILHGNGQVPLADFFEVEGEA
ncbi:MAG: formylmethanofuran dehydrogenase subunit C, partial [Methanobacteriales archaeon HGW-Methanobacteriales-2]